MKLLLPFFFFILLNQSINQYPNTEFMLLGDFNLMSATFSNSDLYLKNKLSYFNLSQYNYIPNFKNITLDYVLSNSFSFIVKKYLYPKLLPSIDIHTYICMFYIRTYKHYDHLNTKKYALDLKSGDYKSIIKYLGSINWLNHFNSDIIYNINDFYYYIKYATN